MTHEPRPLLERAPVSPSAIVTTSADSVPMLDLAAWEAAPEGERQSASSELAASLEAVGFLLLSGHGVPGELSDALVASARTFFARPVADKMAVHRRRGGDPGYYPPATSRLAQSIGQASPPDLKESFAMAPLDRGTTDYFQGPDADRWFPPNLWPDEPASLQTNFCAYFRAMEVLSDRLLRVFALALELPPDWFEGHTTRHTSTAGVLHYPPPSQAPEPGQLRAGAHSDYGTLTILHKAGDARGLQVQRRDGSWLDVVPPPGCFVVNIGDLMAEWTGGRWVSTMHRVINPPFDPATATDTTEGDISVAFFHQPDYDAMVRPLHADGNAVAGVRAGRQIADKVDRMHAGAVR